MKTRYILFAVAALMISACARNNEPSEPEGMQMTFTAYQEGSEMTRTTVQGGGTQVYWEPADEIKVFFNGSSGRFVSQNSENVTVATFTGTINVVAGANEGGNANYTTWGLYPYRSDATSDGLSVTTTLPAKQTGRAGSFAKNTNITLAQSAGLNLAFYNVCGGLRFSLTQEGIKRVTFEGNNGEAIAGKIKIAFEDGIPVVQEVSDGESVISLTAPGGGTFQTSQWYYISAIPGSLPGGYKMVFYKESESAKLTSSSSVTFKRGIFGSLADADEDLVFKPSGSGDDPNPDDAIQFADPVAKYACVEKFDTNGDGEVSYAEASAATTLNGLFTDWNTVTSFDEIKYFTGVTSTIDVFSDLTQLKHIAIPEWITTLGSFQNCSALDTVTLPKALLSIPASCFDGCSSLKDVTLPMSIASIPDYCFRNCTGLTTLALPSTVTSIGHLAFSGCTQLTGLDLPSSLKTIGNNAFQDCQAITSMSLPASLTDIGYYAFCGCRSLVAITIGNGVSIGGYAFSGCSSLSSVVLPEDMTSIPLYCFQNCTQLSTITWPTELTTICNNAFEGCRFEGSGCVLQLPSSVTTIGNNTFGYVRHVILTSPSIISIEQNTFRQGFTNLYVPANLVEMYKVRTNWSNYEDCIRSIDDYPFNPVDGTIGEAVDLGLSVKWASWNIGASTPEGYGTYFAWGEVEPKESYSWDNYVFCDGSDNTLTMYNTYSSKGKKDYKLSLDIVDDVAHIKWGGSWRLPTKKEMQELIDNCIVDTITLNGVSGIRYTSTKDGYTDRYIFFPYAGYYFSSINETLGERVDLWASEIDDNRPNNAYCLAAHYNTYNIVSTMTRAFGQPIRPVCD